MMIDETQDATRSTRHAHWTERGLAAWLSFIIIAQPMALHATEIQPADGHTTLDESANGTTIVNIARPNASGMSHNRYGTFNVSDQGVVLNNSNKLVQTDIGGYIQANPHLGNGSASLILNEVVSTNPSSLLGPIEIGGRQADLVIANPNGITCSGCGFINTVRGTLTTGTPLLSGGALTGFDVRGGTVSFDGAGANMQDAARFDVLAGAIRLNADIRGRELNLLSGHQQVAYSDLSVTANDATPDPANEFAISSTALGGIYGDRIRMIANDAGVGVHLDAPVAAQLGNVEITSAGTLRFTRVSAADDAVITAQDITADGAITAADRLDLTAAADIHLRQDTADARRIQIDAQQLHIDEDAAIATRLLEAELNSLDNQGIINADVANINASASLANHGIIEGRHLTVDSGAFDNTGGSIVATGRLDLSVDNYTHRGDIQADTLTLNSRSNIVLDEAADWKLAGDATLTAAGTLDNRGILSSADTLSLNANRVVNSGSIAAQQSLAIDSAAVTNNADALMLAGTDMTIKTNNLANKGDLYAVDSIMLSGLARQAARKVDNRGGFIGTLNGNIRIIADHIINIGVGEFTGDITWKDPVTSFPDDGKGQSYNERCFMRNKDSGCKSAAYRDTTHNQVVRADQMTPELLPQSGVILAGGDLKISTHVLENLYSLLGAQGDVAIDVYRDANGNAGTVINAGYDVELRSEVRTDKSWYVQRSKKWEENRKYVYSSIPFDENPERCGHHRVRCEKGGETFSSSTFKQTVLGARIAAGGAVRITGAGTIGNGSRESYVSFANTQAAQRGDGLADTPLYRLDPLTTGGFTLPGRNGLFVFNGDPNHPYLIETNPLFATYDGFVGSTYMLDRLGWDPDGGQRLLGDSFYELNLLQNALLGQPVLAGAAQQEREQFFTLLMDQGIAAAESLDLAVGVSLSAEQVNALQSDIIWIEEREVAGHKVLVPVVYLANGIQAPDALIAGQSVELDAGAISSGGTVRAQDNLALHATDGSVTNTGNLVAGDQLALSASDDIINRSGVIRGGDVTLTADGDIRNETASEQLAIGSQHYTLLGEQARIEASGTLTLDSGKDVLVRGAEMSAQQLNVLADGNIEVDTIEIRRSYNMDGPARNKLDTISHLGAELSSALDTLMRAEQDIALAGATLTGGGDVALFAGNDLRIEAVQDRYYSYLEQSSSSTFSSKKVITEVDSTEQVGTQIQAGGQLTLGAAAGDIALLASSAHGEQGVAVSAGNDVRIESGINTDYQRKQTIKKNAARVKTRDQGSETQTLAEAGLTSAGNLEIDAGGNVALAAASLSAEDTVRIGNAEVATDDQGNMILDDEGRPVIRRGDIDNIQLGTVELNNREWDETTRELRGPVKELAKAASLGVALVMPGLTLAGTPEITLSSKDGTHHQQSTEVGSRADAENIQLVANEQITLTGSALQADAQDGTVVMLADDITLDTAVTETTDVTVHEETSVAGIAPSASKDEVTIGGARYTDDRQRNEVVTTTHVGSSISGNRIVMEADSAIRLVNADISASGDDGALSLSASDIEVTGIQDTRSETTTRETETRELTVGVRNAYVDTAYAIKAVEEAAEAVNGARRALRDAEKAYDRGEISAGALDDHKTMLTLASANLVQAELAAAQSLAGSAAAAGSSLGTGFYVSGNAQVTETSSMQHRSEANWQGSNLSAANMSIEADVASIIGSDVNAGRLDLNADTILLGAGTNTQSTRSEQDSRQLGVGVSSSGGGSWNASAGYNEASSSSSATQHVNTRLNVGHLDSSSDDLTLRGAVVNANSANITTGTLTIESLQDTQHSENSSMGVNAGIGGSMASFGVPQSGSGGGSFGKGDSDSAITGEQSALLVTNGADSQITANHTNLVGGMIANASWEMPEGADENTAPVLVDHGQLNFTTDTLTATDLRDYSHSSQTGFGLQTGTSSTTISAISEGHRMEGLTLATVGGGSVLVNGNTLADSTINRDLDAARIVTLDQQTGALNGGVTLDHRLFSEQGRQQIAEEQRNAGRNWQVVSSAIDRDIQRVSVDIVPDSVADKLIALDGYTGGALPFNPNDSGGVLGQLPVALGSRDIYNRNLVVVSENSGFYNRNPELDYIAIEEHPLFGTLSPERQQELAGLYFADVTGALDANSVTRHNFTNGMLNSEADALSNAFQQTQTGVPGGPVEFTLNYNPTRGGVGDLIEIVSDKASGMGLYKLGHASGISKQTGEFMITVNEYRGDMADLVFSAHSQGNILSYTGIKLYNPTFDRGTHFMSAGSPVSNPLMYGALENAGIQYQISQSASGDAVSEVLGGNVGTYVFDGSNALTPHGFEDAINSIKAPGAILWNAGDFGGLIGADSPHSSYRCAEETGLCGP